MPCNSGRRPAKAEGFGEAGRQRCIDDFSWARIAEQTLEIYRTVSLTGDRQRRNPRARGFMES